MIKLENITKVYPGGTVAVKDIDIEVAKGEFVFLVGASGSGKSTLIRLMMREEMPTNGDVWVAGKHASHLQNWKVPHLRRSIGTVFQDFKLLPTKTVYENVAFAMEVTGKHRSVIRNQVPQVLKLVGLSANADRLPNQLSGGEQQRVAIARAFVNRPLILLADEPTGNLDPGTSVGIMRILDRINRTGTTVVMATHDHAIVDAMRRRVIQLDRGRIVRDESRGIYEETRISGPDDDTAVPDTSPIDTVSDPQNAPAPEPELDVPTAATPDDAAVVSGNDADAAVEVDPVSESDDIVVVSGDDAEVDPVPESDDATGELPVTDDAPSTDDVEGSS